LSSSEITSPKYHVNANNISASLNITITTTIAIRIATSSTNITASATVKATATATTTATATQVRVEVAWLIFMSRHSQIAEVPSLSASQLASLDKILSEFGLVDAQRVKDIEKTTNHDVKAVEYYLKEKVTRFMSCVGTTLRGGGTMSQGGYGNGDCDAHGGGDSYADVGDDGDGGGAVSGGKVMMQHGDNTIFSD
jgi:hypothetical protein